MLCKPVIGKKVMTGDSACCGSRFKRGTEVTIISVGYVGCISSVGSLSDFITVKDFRGRRAYHCSKCLSSIK
jgi:hypothetical protein